MSAPRILYDGWPLAYQPNHPAAIHLLTLLENHPAEFSAMVALPEPSFHILPGNIEQYPGEASHKKDEFPRKSVSRLVWEQNVLPGVARKVGASLVHFTSGGAALLGKTHSLLSPADFWDDDFYLESGDEWLKLSQRLRNSLAFGGLARNTTVLWPQDLPAPEKAFQLVCLPPVLPSSFTIGNKALNEQEVDAGTILQDLENFHVYLGPSSMKDLRFLLNTWRWAAGSLGDGYQLVILGADHEACQRVKKLVDEFHLEDSVKWLSAVSMPLLARIFHACRALVHPARIAPWGGALRLALASGKPLVCWETHLTDALAGPAGFLISKRDDEIQTVRDLGAALISVSVDDQLAESLSQSTLDRVKAWDAVAFSQALSMLYAGLIA